MKKPITWLLPILLILTSCLPIAAPTAITGDTSDSNDALVQDMDPLAEFKPGLIPAAWDALEDLKGASIYHIDYTINSDLVTTEADQTVRYTNREGVALEEIVVRLLPNVLNGYMEVSQTSLDGKPAEVTYSLQDSLLRIPLENGLPPGESVELGFSFSVKVPNELESNYGILAFYDNVLTLAHCYPMIAVYDDEGWNAEIPPDQGDPTYADASFFIVSIDAPIDITLVASGRETNREELGDRQRVQYLAGPARDFFIAASPDYEAVSKTVDGVTFNSYASNDAREGAQAALEYAVASMEVFGERYSPYPYTEFDIVATPTYALGVEYPGIVAITNRLYDLDGSLSGMPNKTLMESVVVHEAGHQWFYNMVGNDQLDEPWLDESLTQYVTWQYYDDRYGAGGPSGFEASLRSRWSRVDNQPIPIGLPVADYQGASYGAIVYGRGAFFFEALRDEIGQSTFDTFMQEYTRRYSWEIASGDSLLALAEETCACDLSGLYGKWVTP